MDYSQPLELQPSDAERRPAVPLPAPFPGSSKALRDEYTLLRARCDALANDKELAAQHRADFAAELETLTESHALVKGEPTTMREEIAELTGDAVVEESASIAWEATTIRDIGINLLRKELAIRVDLGAYSERWRAEGQKAQGVLRAKLEETRAEILRGLIEFGYDDPVTNKLSPCRVLPGYIFSHPKVLAARNVCDTARGTLSHWSIGDNNLAIQELKRMIREEAARLAGLSVR